MITPKITLEPKELADFNRQIERFIIETGRDAARVIKQEAALFVKDLIRVTPPFRNSFTETFNQQRDIGRKAVDRDIRKVFTSLREFVNRISENSPKLALNLSLAGGLGAVNVLSRKQGFRNSSVDMDSLEAMFRNMGMGGRIVREASEAIHEQARSANGRVGRVQFIVVVNERSIERYIKEKQSHVGKAKSGWMKAAIELGVKGIPGWIRDHLVPGVFWDQLNSDEHSVTVGNLIEYGKDFDKDQFVAAITSRQRSLKIQLEKIMAHRARKANSGRTV